MASDSPSSDIVFSVKPNAHTATNDASTDTGSARPVMTVERQELRNRNTTATVRAAPSRSAALDARHRIGHAHAAVLHDTQGHAGRQRGLDLGHARAHLLGDGGGAEPRGLQDVDADRLVVVEEREGSRFFGAVLDVGHVAQPHDASAGLRDDDVLELGGRVQPSLQADRALIQLAFEPPDRHGQVLRLQRLHHLAHADPAGLEVARPHLHDQLALDGAGQVHRGDAVDAAQPPRDAGIGEPGQLGAAETRRRQRQRDDRAIGRVELRQHRLFHLAAAARCGCPRSCRGSPARRRGDPSRNRTRR